MYKIKKKTLTKISLTVEITYFRWTLSFVGIKGVWGIRPLNPDKFRTFYKYAYSQKKDKKSERFCILRMKKY